MYFSMYTTLLKWQCYRNKEQNSNCHGLGTKQRKIDVYVQQPLEGSCSVTTILHLDCYGGHKPTEVIKSHKGKYTHMQIHVKLGN